MKLPRVRIFLAVCMLAALALTAGCGVKETARKTGKSGSKPVASKAETPKDVAKGDKPAEPPAGDVGLNIPLPPSSLEEALNPLAKKPTSDPLDVLRRPAKPAASLKPGAPGTPAKPLAPDVKPDPKQLLAVVQNVYRSLGSLKVEGSSSVSIKADGKVVDKQQSERFTTVFKQPDKFVTTSPDSTLTGNGKTVWAYSKAAKRYTKTAFNKDIARALVQSKPGVGIMGLVFGVDYVEAVSSFKLLKDTKIRGQDMLVLQLQFKNGSAAPPDTNVTQTLWIGRSDLMIHKNNVVAKTKPRPTKDFKGEMPKLIETTMTGSLDECVLNPKLNNSFFDFKPPAGVKPFEKPKEVNPIDKAAPDFEFTWTDGTKKKLSDLRDKPVLLIFWAMPMPEDQLPAIESAYDKHKDAAHVIAINLNEEADKIKELVRSKGYGVPVVFGSEEIAKAAIRNYGVKGIPAVYVIDTQGIVKRAMIGMPDEKDLAEILRKIDLAH